jgi:hypothetical protein
MKNKIEKKLKEYLNENEIPLNDIMSKDIQTFTIINQKFLGYEIIEKGNYWEAWYEAQFYIGKIIIIFETDIKIKFYKNKFKNVVEELFRLYEESKKVKKLFNIKIPIDKSYKLFYY